MTACSLICYNSFVVIFVTKYMNGQTATKQRKILNISLPAKMYFEIERSAVREASTKAELAREAIRQYLADKRDWQKIFKLGRATAKKFGIKNEDDVERIVDEIRCSK